MIKCSGVFDKVKDYVNMPDHEAISYWKSTMEDALLDVDAWIDTVPCPHCHAPDILHTYVDSRTHTVLIRPDLQEQIELALPRYAYRCPACGKHGIDEISTDAFIHSTRFFYAYSYILEMFYAKYYDKGNQDHMKSFLKDLGVQTVERWKHRYQDAMDRLMFLLPSGIRREDVLQSKVNLSHAMKFFFKAKVIVSCVPPNPMSSTFSNTASTSKMHGSHGVVPIFVIYGRFLSTLNPGWL